MASSRPLPRRHLFFIATMLEAEAVIHELSAIRKNAFTYVFDGGEIVVTGMGPMAAFFSAKRVVSCGEKWINIGVAGTFDQTILPGTVVQIGEVRTLKWRAETSSFLPSQRPAIVMDEREVATLYTAARPVYHTPEGMTSCSYVDMEGYQIAYVARQRGIPCTIIKVVSDYCDNCSHQAILKGMPSFSAQLARVALAT